MVINTKSNNKVCNLEASKRVIFVQTYSLWQIILCCTNCCDQTVAQSNTIT